MKKITRGLSVVAALITGCMFQSANAQWLTSGTNIYNNNTGKVGIGTSTTTVPSGLLTVKGAGSVPAASWVAAGAPLFTGFGETAVGNADYILAMASTSNNGRPVFVGRRSRGTLALPTPLVSNDFIMSMLASGYDGTAFQNPATIDFFVDGAVSAGNVPTRISFVTGSNSTNRAERLKIGNTGDITINTNQLFVQKATGNVGIGSTTPVAKLDVAGNIKIADGTQGTGKVLTSDSTGLATWQTPVAGGNQWTTSGANISISNSGNVGIGTTAPDAKLHVAGNVKIVDGTQEFGRVLTSDATGLASWKDPATDNTRWSLTGNASINPANNFIGTTDGNPLILKTSNNERMRINQGGKVGIGISNPNHLLHINGGDLFVESSSGLIRLGYEGANEWQMATTGAGADLRWYTTTDGGTTITPRHYFSQNGDMGIGGFSGNRVPIGRLDVIGAGTTSSTNNLVLRNSNLDTIMRVRNDGRIGIGYNGTTYGRTINLGGTGINFYTASEAAFGGAVFPTDTSLILWSNSNANNYLVMQPSWGNVGIGTYTPNSKLHVNGRVGIGSNSISVNGQLELSADEGRKPSTSTWTIVSDARLKNIDGSYTKGLADILQLNPITYHYKSVGKRQFDEKALNTQSIGFTAQDVQKIFPEAVSTDDDGYLSLNIHPILIAQVNAFKEQQKQIEAKDATIITLQKDVETLKAQMSEMMKNFSSMKQTQEACCTATQSKASNQTETVENVETPVLEQNAPNPVNNTTVIRYKLPSTVKVAQMTITEAKGTVIKSFNLNAKGNGQVTLSAGTLATGTYFYSLITDGRKVATKEMQIIK